jgi:hypothetical protein
MAKEYYSAEEFVAAQKEVQKVAKGMDLHTAAKEIADGKRSFDQKLIDAIPLGGMTYKQFDDLVKDFREIPNLKAAAADGDRSVGPELESLLLRLDPSYQELANERATAAKHAQDFKNKIASIEQEAGLRKNKLQSKTVFDPISGEILRSNEDFAWIEKELNDYNAKLFNLRRSSKAAQNRFEQLRDNCTRYLRSEDLIMVQGFDAEIISVIEQEIQENEASIQKSKEWKSFRSGQLKDIPEWEHDQRRIFIEEIDKADRNVAGREATNKKLRAWLAEIQPAEVAAL